MDAHPIDPGLKAGQAMAAALHGLLDRVRGAREALPHLAVLERALPLEGLALLDRVPLPALHRMAAQLAALPVAADDRPLRALQLRLHESLARRAPVPDPAGPSTRAAPPAPQGPAAVTPVHAPDQPGIETVAEPPVPMLPESPATAWGASGTLAAAPAGPLPALELTLSLDLPPDPPAPGRPAAASPPAAPAAATRRAPPPLTRAPMDTVEVIELGPSQWDEAGALFATTPDRPR